MRLLLALLVAVTAACPADADERALLRRIVELEARADSMAAWMDRAGPIGGSISSYRSEVTPYGFYYAAWNVTGTVIRDGTVVMSDSTRIPGVPPIVYGKGFSVYTGLSGAALGVALGDIPSYSKGRIMTFGWHNHVAITSRPLRPGSYVRASRTFPGSVESCEPGDPRALGQATRVYGDRAYMFLSARP